MIKNLKDAANSLSLDPELVVMMELQAFLNELVLIRNRDNNDNLSQEDQNYLRSCELADLKYDKLPTAFFKRILSAVPEEASMTKLDDKWTDLPFLLKLWNRQIEISYQLAGKGAVLQQNLVKFQKLVRERLKEGKSEMPRSETNLDPINYSIQPDRDVLKRMEGELGFCILDTSDVLTMKSSGHVLKVDLGLEPIVGTKRTNSDERRNFEFSKRNRL